MVLKNCTTEEAVTSEVRKGGPIPVVLLLYRSDEPSHANAVENLRDIEQRHPQIIFAPVDTVNMPDLEKRENFDPQQGPQYVVYWRNHRTQSLPLNQSKKLEDRLKKWWMSKARKNPSV